MYIINPDPYSLPAYRIGPFQTKDLSKNHHLKDSDKIDEYFADRFSGSNYYYTFNGRRAINLALKQYNLSKDDVVTIFTTSENFYISGCVTAEIEKFCKWSRKLESGSKLIFVNHEFGYPHPDMEGLRKHGLPIIEDCANTFFSNSEKDSIGKYGNYIIYSFPKTFPLQIGGLLVSNKGPVPHQSLIGEDELRHVKNILSHYIGSADDIIKARRSNYNYLRSRFESLGLTERFNLDPDIMPGVFMFRTTNSKIDLPALKVWFWNHGIQSSVFYGEDAFFVPVHQNLSQDDLDYFYEVMKAFMSTLN